MHPSGPSSNLTGVLMRRRNLDRERHPCDGHAQRKGWVGTQQAQGKGFRRNLAFPHLDLGLPASRKWCEKTNFCLLWCIVMAAAANWYISVYSPLLRPSQGFPLHYKSKLKFLQRPTGPLSPGLHGLSLTLLLFLSPLFILFEPFYWSFKTAVTFCPQGLFTFWHLYWETHAPDTCMTHSFISFGFLLIPGHPVQRSTRSSPSLRPSPLWISFSF